MITSSTLLHIRQISLIPLMKKSSTSKHSSSPTNTILNLLPTKFSQFSSSGTQDHFTPDLRSEPCATTAAATPATASAPNASSPDTMSNLDPANPLSASTEKPSNFISTYPLDNPMKEPNSIPYYTSIDSPKSEPSHFSETSPTKLPTEELMSMISYSSNIIYQ